MYKMEEHEKPYVIIISDDQVDYLIGFDNYNINTNLKLKAPMILPYIENKDFFFKTEEEAKKMANALNNTLSGDYGERSSQIGIILDLHDKNEQHEAEIYLDTIYPYERKKRKMKEEINQRLKKYKLSKHLIERDESMMYSKCEDSASCSKEMGRIEMLKWILFLMEEE